MKQMNEKDIKDFFRANDPAVVDGGRAEKMMFALWQRLDETPAFVAPSAPAGFFARRGVFFSLSRGLAMAVLFLTLGIFAGNGLTISGQAAGEKISVYAMAEPWENLIVEE